MEMTSEDVINNKWRFIYSRFRRCINYSNNEVIVNKFISPIVGSFHFSLNAEVETEAPFTIRSKREKKTNANFPLILFAIAPCSPSVEISFATI